VDTTEARPLASTLLDTGDPDRVALVDGARTLTYAALRRRVAQRAGELGLDERSVVVLGASNTLEFVVTYLALLAGDHVPLLAGAHVDRLAAAWRPGAVITTGPPGIEIERHAPDRRPLHPDLRLLLSTSGSTGAPKLVRLSDRNLVSNAEAIGRYLGLGPSDRGITSLPLHYCYGLSVLHSHLAAGASVVLTEASVVDACFHAAMADHAVTNLAGVPHSFDLLERAGPERVRVPSLRFLTVAGGRMPAEPLARWHARADDWGVPLYVMYGQTEATARMAYVPPHLARHHPGAIGVPIPGGHLELRPVEGQADGVGELIYRGPNVMMGYAVEDDDLATGAVLDELATGDLGRFDAAAGLFEIVGRRSRFVKPFGLRIDLEVVEDELAANFVDVAVAGDDELVAVSAPGADPGALTAAATAATGLPEHCIAVTVTGPLPRTDRGKVDRAAVLAAARSAGRPAASSETEGSAARVLETVLGRPGVRPTDTFVSLGGDSLNYVECSLRLERTLGHLPADWHVRPVGDLVSQIGRRRARLDTTVLLRAIGICAIVATHMGLRHIPGGAHILLAVVGYNTSRFLLPIDSTRDRVVAGLRTVARVAVPTVVWVAVGVLVFGAYSVGTLLLLNNYVGSPGHRDDHWHFWFIEVFVHLALLTTLLLAVPSVRRRERAHPYAFPLVLLAGALLLRLEWAQMGDWYNLRFRTHGIAWFFLLGWLVQRSHTVRQKLITSAVCMLTVPGFFHNPSREWFVVGALVLLVWAAQVRMPRPAQRPVAVVAAASMWILVTHFTVWPVLAAQLALPVAYVLTIAAGVTVAALVQHGARLFRRVAWPRRTQAVTLATISS